MLRFHVPNWEEGHAKPHCNGVKWEIQVTHNQSSGLLEAKDWFCSLCGGRIPLEVFDVEPRISFNQAPTR